LAQRPEHLVRRHGLAGICLRQRTGSARGPSGAVWPVTTLRMFVM